MSGLPTAFLWTILTFPKAKCRRLLHHSYTIDLLRPPSAPMLNRSAGALYPPRRVDHGVYQESEKRMMRRYAGLLLAVLVLAGCRVPAARVPGSSAAQKPGLANSFIAGLLQAHGEKNVMTTPDGVGVAGNTARIQSALYGLKQQGGDFNAEVEFRIHLPGGQEIVDYVVGLGNSEEKAEQDAFGNFALTTFHPVYKSFINPADPHQAVNTVTLQNGQKREIAVGDLFVRGGQKGEKLDFSATQAQIKTALARMPLTEGPHWIKIVYGQMKSQPITVSATLDNEENADLTAAVKACEWPRRQEVYIAKQFIIVK